MIQINKNEKTISKKTVSHVQLFSKLFSSPVFVPPKMTITSDFTEVFVWCGKQDLNRLFMKNLDKFNRQNGLLYQLFLLFWKISVNHDKYQLFSKLFSNCIQTVFRKAPIPIKMSSQNHEMNISILTWKSPFIVY